MVSVSTVQMCTIESDAAETTGDVEVKKLLDCHSEISLGLFTLRKIFPEVCSYF